MVTEEPLTPKENGMPHAVKMTTRDIAVIIGLVSAAMTGLGWFISNTVGKDLTHHIDTDDSRHITHCKQIDDLQKEDKTIKNDIRTQREILIRMEAVQRIANPKAAGKVPIPDPLADGGHD